MANIDKLYKKSFVGIQRVTSLLRQTIYGKGWLKSMRIIHRISKIRYGNLGFPRVFPAALQA